MFQDGWIIRYIGSPADHSYSWQDDPHRLALPNNPVQKSSAPRVQKVALQDQHTGNLTVKPISRSKSLPRTESRHQIRLAIMLPLHITPSPHTLLTPFSRIIRSHNTLSSSFHSFFKVLLSFPSQYFFAIGFPVIFRLWWILSPFQSILPNKFTLYPRQFFSLQPTVTRLSLSLAHISMRFPPASAVKSSRSRLQCATRTPIASDQSVTECRRYQLGPFLFHSPLLKKSLLFFHPSLIDMLKLRESTYRPQINRMYGSSKRVQLPNPISIHRFDRPLAVYQKLNFFDLWYWNPYMPFGKSILSCIQSSAFHIVWVMLLIAIHCVLHRPGNQTIQSIIFFSFLSVSIFEVLG